MDCDDGILCLGLDEEELEDETDSDLEREEEHSAEKTKTTAARDGESHKIAHVRHGLLLPAQSTKQRITMFDHQRHENQSDPQHPRFQTMEHVIASSMRLQTSQTDAESVAPF